MTTGHSSKNLIKLKMKIKQTLLLGGGTVFGALAAVVQMIVKTPDDTDAASDSKGSNPKLETVHTKGNSENGGAASGPRSRIAPNRNQIAKNTSKIDETLSHFLGTPSVMKNQSRILLSFAVVLLGYSQPVLAGEEKQTEHLQNIERGQIQLKDLSGQLADPLADQGQKATVLFFLTTECPIGNLYSPEINRIVEQYKKQGVTFLAVYAFETPVEIKKHRKEYKLSLNAFLDPEVKLATLTGATVTPEACVLSKDGKVLYRGRIDDRAVKFGTVRVEPRVRDLRLALDAVLAGKPVAQKITKPIGCYISFPETSLPKQSK